MTSAVIVSTARTPLAKSWRGSFNLTHGATLGGHVVQHAIQRAGIGTRTLALSVPCRNIHSPHSVCALRDVAAQQELARAFLAAL